MASKIEKKNLIQIADIAGVSLTTASRAFSNHPYVKEATRKKVFAAAHQLNYEPRIPASKRIIGVVVESLEFIHQDFYLSTILSYIARELSGSSLGFELIPIKEINRLEENFIGTALAILYLEDSLKEMQKCTQTKFILINNLIEGFSCVCSDHQQGIRLAYDQLKSAGHTNIALFMDYFGGWGASERKKAFLELLERDNSPLMEELVKDASCQRLKQSLQEALGAGMTAAIVTSEGSILRTMGEINRLGIAVPQDLSVISFENVGVSQYLNPPQTTICQGFEAIVRNAVELAEKSINEQLPSPIKILLDNSLIMRDSVRKI